MSAQRSAEEFLNRINCGYEGALDAGVSESDYELPTAVADAWADMRLAYDEYTTTTAGFEDALDGADLTTPGGDDSKGRVP